MYFKRLLSRKRAILGTFHLTSGKSRCASGTLPIARRSTLALGDGVRLFRRRCIQTKVSLSTMPRRSVVGVTHLPAIHRAGQLGLQIAVSGPPPLDATELKPSSVTNCLTAIPVGFTPCSMNCSKRLLDAVPYRKRSAAPKAIFCHTDQATCLCHLDRARHVERSFDYEMTICWLIIL